MLETVANVYAMRLVPLDLKSLLLLISATLLLAMPRTHAQREKLPDQR